jgi:hypothetical protein
VRLKPQVSAPLAVPEAVPSWVQNAASPSDVQLLHVAPVSSEQRTMVVLFPHG